jgi:hypothetical protein
VKNSKWAITAKDSWLDPTKPLKAQALAKPFPGVSIQGTFSRDVDFVLKRSGTVLMAE